MARIDVGRWVNEHGKRTRRWYWEVHYSGNHVAAGFGTSEDDARQKAVTALALAAYQAGAASCG